MKCPLPVVLSGLTLGKTDVSAFRRDKRNCPQYPGVRIKGVFHCQIPFLVLFHVFVKLCDFVINRHPCTHPIPSFVFGGFRQTK